MKSIKKVAALIASAIALTLLAAGPASALSERSRSQTFVLYGVGSTFDHPISVLAAGPISGVGSFEIVDERSGPDGDDFTAELVFPGRGTCEGSRGSRSTQGAAPAPRPVESTGRSRAARASSGPLSEAAAAPTPEGSSSSAERAVASKTTQ